jgi:hypothetical protein
MDAATKESSGKDIGLADAVKGQPGKNKNCKNFHNSLSHSSFMISRVYAGMKIDLRVSQNLIRLRVLTTLFPGQARTKSELTVKLDGGAA